MSDVPEMQKEVLDRLGIDDYDAATIRQCYDFALAGITAGEDLFVDSMPQYVCGGIALKISHLTKLIDKVMVMEDDTLELIAALNDDDRKRIFATGSEAAPQ